MAFGGCPRLRKITLPSTLTRVAADAFAGCRSLSTLIGGSADFPVIGNALYSQQGTCLLMFPPAYAQEKYQIPKGVTVVDETVQFPTMLRELFIPESVIAISPDSFAYCAADLVVHVPAGSVAEAFFRQSLPHITLSNNMDFGASDPGEAVLIVTWPDGEPQVGVAFQLTCLRNDTPLAPSDVNWSVDLPEIASVTEEGMLTFLHPGAPSVTASLKTDASVSCTISLICHPSRSLVLPDSLREVSEEAFCGGSMEGVVFPETMERIGSRAFADCPWLFEVRIPDSVTDIADDAFSGSPNVWIFCNEDSYASDYASRMDMNCIYTPKS